LSIACSLTRFVGHVYGSKVAVGVCLTDNGSGSLNTSLVFVLFLVSNLMSGNCVESSTPWTRTAPRKQPCPFNQLFSVSVILVT
jgi:hypothetical protein